MNFVWDPRNIPVTLPPNDFDQIPDILWTKLKGTPTQAVDRGILQYTYADVQRCISESYCVLTLSICFIIFIFLSLFILTILLLYLISSIRSLLSQIYCIFYQMTYAVSPSRWKVSEAELEDLRKQVLLSRDVANQRFRSLDDEKLQIHKFLKNFEL